MPKEKLFSVTANDCEWQTFTSGGKGGQHQNKNQTGVRCIHKPSGAVGEARDNKSQLINKRNAFVRMSQTDKFKKWLTLETARYTGKLNEIQQKVERQMKPENLRVETFVDGKWIEYKEDL